MSFSVFDFPLRSQTPEAVKESASSISKTADGTGAAQDLEFIGLGRAVHSRAQLGSVLTMTAVVRNAGDQERVAELIGRISGQIGEEDRRRVVVPAKKDVTVELNIRILPDYKSTSVDAIVTLSVIENGREILLHKGEEPISRTLLTNLVTEPSRTAATIGIEPPETVYFRWPKTEPFYAYEMVVGTRVDSSLSRICMNIESQPLPIGLSDWIGFDVAAIGDPKALMDGASIAAMQQFLINGGRVWVMLDRVDTSLIAPLLASDQECVDVDTVELTQFVVGMHGPMDFLEEDRTVTSEKPLPMKRVLQTGGRVSHSIDGWPIAIWYSVGKGEVLLTTLDAQGWLQERTTQDSNDVKFQCNYRVPMWGGTFSSNIHSPKPPLPFTSEPPSYPLDRIGNPIVSRQLVTAVLLSFCIALGLVGAWRWMAGELRWMGLLAPGIGLVASIPMLIVAQSMRQGMPNMVSILQLVEFGNNNPGLIRERAAVFTSSPLDMDLAGNTDGYATPSQGITSGIRKCIVDEFQSWRMANGAWPAGTWRYSTESALKTGPYEAHGYFTDRGIRVELPEGIAKDIEDVVVCHIPGLPTLTTAGEKPNARLMDGTLAAGGDRWIADALVDGEQLRRTTIYRAIFEDPKYSPRRPPSRVVYGWTDLNPEGPHWNSELDRRGAALLAMPLTLVSPRVGDEIFIPHSMINIIPPKGGTSSAIYNASSARWIDESNLETKAAVIFELPHQVVPLDVSKIQVDLNIRAPKRNVRLYWKQGYQFVNIVTMNDPSIPWQGTLDDPMILKDMADGQLELHLEVSHDRENRDSSSQGTFMPWHLKHLRLSVNGRVLPSHQLVNTTP